MLRKTGCLIFYRINYFNVGYMLLSISNVVQPDSGLVAVVTMGLVLANQNKVVVRHILVLKT